MTSPAFQSLLVDHIWILLLLQIIFSKVPVLMLLYLIVEHLGQKNPLVSGNAGDKKNLHPGGRKFIFLIDFLEIFSFLLQFLLPFLYFCLFLLVCLFFEIKNIYPDTHSTMRAGFRISGNKISFFWPYNGSFSCFRGLFRQVQDFTFNLRFEFSFIAILFRMVYKKKFFRRSSVKYQTFSEGPT